MAHYDDDDDEIVFGLHSLGNSRLVLIFNVSRMIPRIVEKIFLSTIFILKHFKPICAVFIISGRVLDKESWNYWESLVRTRNLSIFCLKYRSPILTTLWSVAIYTYFLVPKIYSNIYVYIYSQFWSSNFYIADIRAWYIYSTLHGVIRNIDT